LNPAFVTSVAVVSFLLSLSFYTFTQGRGKLADFPEIVQLIKMDSATSTYNEKSFTLLKHLNAPWTGQRCVLVPASRQCAPGRSFQKQVFLSSVLCLYPCSLSPCVFTAAYTMSHSLAQDRSANDKQ